ncbi:hypothetical protein SEUCBS139899_003999 [Sporothrix eucalyptigena]|uniref:N-acetyltransferase domain-containing protein n=1 Tax=Sporothrix eucalyptigena TaxID=1812306 RepID=A0ABP0AK85_9PEZI
MTSVPDGALVFHDWVTVLTTLPTLPLPLNSQRVALETERLIIRPLTEDDLPALHEMRLLPEVMRNTKQGTVDANIEYTRERLIPFLPPNDAASFNCAICIREAGDNKLIGIGGVHSFHSVFGWPELGYMFHSAHWGKGYATEFVRGFLQLYSQLPRPSTPQPLRVTRVTLPAELAAKAGPGTHEQGNYENDPEALAQTVTPDTVVVEEKLTAVVPDRNVESTRVITKGGFTEFMQYMEEDKRLPGSGIEILLRVYNFLPSRKESASAAA